jgi:hypothetical protein
MLRSAKAGQTTQSLNNAIMSTPFVNLNLIPVPDFYDDFSTYTTQGQADSAWVTSNIAKNRVNITTDVLDTIMESKLNTNDCIVHNLTTVSDTEWIIRLKWVITAKVDLTSTTAGSYILMSSTDQTSATNVAQDMLGMLVRCGNYSFLLEDTDGTAPTLAPVSATFALQPSVTTFYMEFKRLSSTSYSYEFFSDEYETSIESKTTTVASTTVNTIYFGIKNYINNDPNGKLTGYIDDVSFWNGITTL